MKIRKKLGKTFSQDAKIAIHLAAAYAQDLERARVLNQICLLFTEALLELRTNPPKTIKEAGEMISLVNETSDMLDRYEERSSDDFKEVYEKHVETIEQKILHLRISKKRRIDIAALM